jgi:predicted hydrocarbon binding protein
MHGIILSELKKYVTEKLGPGAWPKLLSEAGLPNKIYVASTSYPDEEVVALVEAASHLTGKPVDQTLSAFGEYIMPDLLRMYKTLLKAEWDALDLVENIETTIHTAVRMRNPGATPPQLKITRLSPKQVQIAYSSKRKMCALGKGMLTALGSQYHQPLTVTETRCMLRGAAECRIDVKVA